jgi:hypothetical protein
VDEDRHSTDPWFSYGSRTPPEMLLRSPTANETWTLFYKDSIEPVLTAHLDTVLESYFLTLAIITLRKDAKYLSDYDIPCIVILYNPDHDLQSIETQVIEELITSNDYRFMCIIAEGRVEYSNSSNSTTSRQSYMKNPTIGTSIEGLNDGTLGMFMQREDGSIAALSCAHVLGDRGAGYTVTQPAVTDFRKSYQRLETNIGRVKNILTNTKDLITRFEAEEELEALKQELAVWEKLKTDDEAKLVENLRLGETLANGQWEIVTYGERACMADYQFFSIDEGRGPSIKRDYAYPDEGILGSVTWGFSEKTGPLELDLLVRKDGKQTGLTFGFIGGVYGKWRPGNLEDKDFGKMTCSEYWVLEEKGSRDQPFARHGDSGAIVIDKDGVVRGVVFADIPIKKLRVIVDPHGRIPDIAKIAEKRDENGEISVGDITSQVFEGRSFALVQDIEMILKLSAIGGEVMFGW